MKMSAKEENKRLRDFVSELASKHDPGMDDYELLDLLKKGPSLYEVYEFGKR